MGKLAYRCKRPHNKPLWLLRIQCDISVDFINECMAVMVRALPW